MATLDASFNPLPQSHTSTSVDYFESVYDRFESAVRAAGGPVTRSYSIGGCKLKLRFAGSALLHGMTQALEHLEVADPDSASPGDAAALTVCLWDGASTGQKMLPPQWQSEAFLARGVIRGYNDERIHTAFQFGSSTVNLLDVARNLAIVYVPSAADLEYWEKGAPLRTILHWWFVNRGKQLVHAAAIGNEECGVLIGGRGGSGKSTTALACLESSLFYAGDDYALLSIDPEPVVHSLYSSAKLDGNHLQRFPHLLPMISNADRLADEKALLFVNQHYPGRVTRAFPVKAILLPRISGRLETSLSRASTAKALAALAPSTIFQLPGAGNETFMFLARFARQMPVYNLELGTDLTRIPPVIAELLQEIGTA